MRRGGGGTEVDAEDDGGAVAAEEDLVEDLVVVLDLRGGARVGSRKRSLIELCVERRESYGLTRRRIVRRSFPLPR